MADQEAWTVGAAPECDILVDHPTVSGRHCRLTRDNGGFLLEDLDSTNGTFVNGARITAPLSVTSTDDVRLGPETPLPWGKIEPASADQQIIRIGRDPDNDVVLDYPNVSSHHAQIVISESRATIRDLVSTNGIAIGNPHNLVKSATLSETDTVYFGTLAIPAADLLHPGREPFFAKSELSTEGGPAFSPRTVTIAAGALVVLAVVVGLASQFTSPDVPVKIDQDGEIKITTDSVAVVSPKKTVKETTASPATRIANDPADAIYAVLVQHRGTSQLLNVGTAWGMGEHQLVTSGVVARYLEKYRADLTAIQVGCASQEKVFVVSGVVVHPEFKKFEAAIKQPFELAQAKREELEEIQNAKEPPSKEEVDKLAEELIDAKENLYLAGEKMVFYDIGLLNVQEKLPFALKLKPSGRKLAIQAKTTLIGAPYDSESMVSGEQLAATKLEGKVRQIVSPTDDKQSPLQRIQISSPADHHVQQEWRGSPVLNDAGTVIGVYVRPTPPIDPTQPMTGKTYDAVPIDRLDALPAVPLNLPKK